MKRPEGKREVETGPLKGVKQSIKSCEDSFMKIMKLVVLTIPNERMGVKREDTLPLLL